MTKPKKIKMIFQFATIISILDLTFSQNPTKPCEEENQFSCKPTITQNSKLTFLISFILILKQVMIVVNV